MEGGPDTSCAKVQCYGCHYRCQANILIAELFPLFTQILDVIHEGWLAPVVALRQVSEGGIHK